MARPAPTYDLVLLLDTAVDADRRAKILADVEAMIDAQGEVTNRQEWGVRPTAYEIRHKKDAEYHLLQFHGDRDLLALLDRTLHITDNVVRYRIIKLKPGTPALEQPPGREPVAAES
jgi:small subunit ribosomal protein S6